MLSLLFEFEYEYEHELENELEDEVDESNKRCFSSREGIRLFTFANVFVQKGIKSSSSSIDTDAVVLEYERDSAMDDDRDMGGEGYDNEDAEG